jgi:hypothetical protein
MKKIFLNVIFFLLISFNLNAHVSHYKNFKKIEMEIFRNDQLIGFNYYFFEKDKNVMKIKNQTKIIVKLFGTTVFDLEGYGEEKYINEELVSYNSKTKQNKKDKFVNLLLDKKTNKLVIKGSSYTGNAEIENVVGNWWNHKLLQAESQISPISGSIKSQIVTFIAKEKINLYGKVYEAEHFKLKSKNSDLPDDKKLNFDIWLHKDTGLILKVKYSRMGDWEYRLKRYE